MRSFDVLSENMITYKELNKRYNTGEDVEA